MTDKLKTRVKTISELLRKIEPETKGVKYDGINLVINTEPDNGQVVKFEFYKYLIRDVAGQTVAFRHSQYREFDFTVDELDKAIDRLTKRIKRQ